MTVNELNGLSAERQQIYVWRVKKQSSPKIRIQIFLSHKIVMVTISEEGTELLREVW